MGNRTIAKLLAIAAVSLSAVAARAQVDTWTSTSSGAWGTGVNWSAGVPSSANTATFNGSAGLMNGITLLPSSMAGSLSFVSTGGANAYTFDTAATANNNTLTITSGITNSDAANVTFYNTTTLGGSQTWANSGATMTFDGKVNLGSGSSGFALTIDGTNAVNIAGIMANGGSAAGSLIYSGTGTLTLTGANTYTGGTTVSSGTLNIQNNTALGTAAASVASGATLQLQGGLTKVANAITLNGVGSTNAFGNSIGAMDNLSGANTVTGAVTLGSASQINSDAGTLSITTGGITGAGQNLTVGGAGNTTVSGVISTGSGTLTKTGAGTLTLSGANTFSGAASVNAGILNLQSSGSLGTASNTSTTTVASGAVLQMQGNISTTNTGTLVLNGAGTGAGSGALQSVSGNNTWNGNTSLGSNSTIYSSTAGNMLVIGNSSYTSTFAMGGNTLTIDGPGNVQFDANVGVAGDTGGVIKNGTGTLTFYAYDTYYSGATTVNAGTLDLYVGPYAAGYYGIDGALNIGVGPSTPASAGTVIVNIFSDSVANQISPTSAVTINSDGILNVGSSTGLGTLTLNGGQVAISSGETVTASGNLTTNANSAHETSLISGGTFDLVTGNISVARDSSLASDLTISSAISGANGLTKTGNGILTLSGASTYTGSTNIDGGAVSIGADDNLGAAPGSATAGKLTFSGGTLDTTATFTLNSNRGMTLNAGGATFSPSSGTTLTYGGIIAGAGTLTEAGAGALTLSGANTFTGATNLNGGTLNIGADANLGAAPGSATASQLAFNGGTLGTTASFTLNGNRGITLNSAGGTFAPSSGTTLAYGGVIAGTGTLTQAGAGTLTLSGTNTYTGATNLNGGSLSIGADANLGAAPGSVTASQLAFNGGTLATTGTFALNSNRGITLNSGGGTFAPSSGTTLTYGGVVAGTGAVTVNGSGTLSLTGTNTYSGATNLNGGTLSIGSDSNLGTAPGSATAGQLAFNGGTLATTSSLALNSNRGMTVNSGGGTLNAASATTLTFGGLIAGTGSLNLAGSGVINLTNNALSFGGAASVTSGELEFSGTLPSIGTLTLNSGSTLLLSGSDLSVNNLVVTGNAVIDFGSSASILNTTDFTLAAGATLTIKDWNNEVDYFYAQNWTGVTLGTRGTGAEGQVTFTGYPSGGTGWLSYDKEISPAPEPATYGAIFAGISLLGIAIRRRRDSAA